MGTFNSGCGVSRILYQFDDEMLGEIINRTVHCFWLMAIDRTSTGYTLWMAVYVRRLNAFTPVYMALISPVLKWIIYPALRRTIEERWNQIFPFDPHRTGPRMTRVSRAG